MNLIHGGAVREILSADKDDWKSTSKDFSFPDIESEQPSGNIAPADPKRFHEIFGTNVDLIFPRGHEFISLEKGRNVSNATSRVSSRCTKIAEEVLDAADQDGRLCEVLTALRKRRTSHAHFVADVIGELDLKLNTD
ncbi:hypothetical protein GUITHDRAFT_155078 [Guillardia theta CCMP2712]|uniref:Uncharacterized protein n=1 Tax=Guillardia theta (strain CCMP2712) TaxID=905079 RepID=L1ILG4_GUITC|nr:hypothetical protein GUITHDRAFT_155078 [Guillardia theta CCMP2712]EKX36962.1 hypothetical protein GUITHDRAFT_155078 [Guillardia theta CCMP2712]|mmetsp:Transcript_14746/g.50300  ORF Transcript_14746/g.50300 Transcript_14746/m.50300 type:complete len:137 (-) Transcript_14746:100-510(-)|eukprot:XP_005823942.1 hypothetical protein GUITHDRAFT_155078 [Guillardia theta CCMP2712]